jgi:hypothetical protein
MDGMPLMIRKIILPLSMDFIALVFFLFVLGILNTATAFHVTKLIYSNIKTIPTHLICYENQPTEQIDYVFDYV